MQTNRSAFRPGGKSEMTGRVAMPSPAPHHPPPASPPVSISVHLRPLPPCVDSSLRVHAATVARQRRQPRAEPRRSGGLGIFSGLLLLRAAGRQARKRREGERETERAPFLSSPSPGPPREVRSRRSRGLGERAARHQPGGGGGGKKKKPSSVSSRDG